MANAKVWLALLGVFASVVTATLYVGLLSIRPKGILKLSNRTQKLRAHDVQESNLYEVRQRGQRLSKNTSTRVTGINKKNSNCNLNPAETAGHFHSAKSPALLQVKQSTI